jgi:hypothetical protein
MAGFAFLNPHYLLNMVESHQRIVTRRALSGHRPATPNEMARRVGKTTRLPTLGVAGHRREWCVVMGLERD